MLWEEQTRGRGQSAGCVWEGGEPFYGTRVGPGWYQSGAGVARRCQLPFSVLRMLMQATQKRRCNAANCFVAAESRRQRIRSWK
jgi:hypothetical protein